MEGHKHAKKITSHLNRTSLVNKATAGNPERPLARLCSQSQRGIWFTLLSRGASHIIRPILASSDKKNHPEPEAGLPKVSFIIFVP